MATEYRELNAVIRAIWSVKISPDAEIFNALKRAIEEEVKNIEPADVRPVVRGKWLSYPILDDMCYQHYSCSVCKRVEAIPHGYDVKKELPYCHCGADMRGLPE